MSYRENESFISTLGLRKYLMRKNAEQSGEPIEDENIKKFLYDEGEFGEGVLSAFDLDEPELQESVDSGKDATEVVIELYELFPEVEFYDERDLGDKVALLFEINKLGPDKIDELKATLDEWGVDYAFKGPRLRVIAPEVETYLNDVNESKGKISVNKIEGALNKDLLVRSNVKLGSDNVLTIKIDEPNKMSELIDWCDSNLEKLVPGYSIASESDGDGSETNVLYVELEKSDNESFDESISLGGGMKLPYDDNYCIFAKSADKKVTILKINNKKEFQDAERRYGSFINVCSTVGAAKSYTKSFTGPAKEWPVEVLTEEVFTESISDDGYLDDEDFENIRDEIYFDLDVNVEIDFEDSYDYVDEAIRITPDESDPDLLDEIGGWCHDHINSVLDNKYTWTSISYNSDSVTVEVKKKVDESLNEGAMTNGSYSLYNGWVKVPDKDSIPDEYPDLEPEYSEWVERAESCETVEDIDNFLDDVYKLRQQGLLATGEYGKENLIFKELRNNGYLQKVKDMKVEKQNQEMSLESLKESKKLPVRKRRVNEELKLYISLFSYKPWSGAVDTWNTICDADKQDELEYILEDMYPEGLTETQLNDILWFNGDEVLSWLGLSEEGEDEEDYDESLKEGLYDKSFKGPGEYNIYGYKSYYTGDDEPVEDDEELFDHNVQINSVGELDKVIRQMQHGDHGKYVWNFTRLEKVDESLKESENLDEAGSITAEKLGDFIEDSVDSLHNSDFTNNRFVLDDDLCLYVGWSAADEGYEGEADYEDGWIITAKIAEKNDYDWADFDFLDMPYDEDTGDVWDTTITGPRFPDGKWFLEQYEEIRQALDDGEVTV